jgi:hypothetical protein
VHLKHAPAGRPVRPFRLTLSNERTDYLVRHEVTPASAAATQEVWGCRPKVEECHRETKQVTGIEGCQCRRERIVRNHIGCALLVWGRQLEAAPETGRTI